MKHTPGPWEAEKNPQGHYGIFQRDYPHQVAETLNRNTSPEMVKANAHLIAAAPELLEALEETLAEMESLMKARAIIYQGGINISNRAKAAIAKAKGEQP